MKWLKDGDYNTNYFHDVIKARNGINMISRLVHGDGSVLEIRSEIENDVMVFYKDLLGSRKSYLNGIDVRVVRDGYVLSEEQRLKLVQGFDNSKFNVALFGVH